MEKRKNKNGIKYVIISLVVMLVVVGGSVARADISLKELIADKVAVILGEKLSNDLGLINDENLGAFPGPEIYNDVTFYGKVTLSKENFCNLKIDLAEKATTSIANPDDLGHWCNNTNRDVWVDSWVIDFKDPNDLWSSNFTVGTTTCATGNTINKDGLCSKSLTATTSATLMASTHVNTTTRTLISPFNYKTNGYFVGMNAGTHYLELGYGATSTPFLLGANECIVVYSDRSGATTTDEATHGFNGYGDGYFCANAFITY